jgi:hypothetical protein
MLNIGQLASAVQRNCNISDARHAGDFSLCVFLLKMREYYRWENELPITGPLAREEVGQWLAERERMWENLESSPFEPLPLENGALDPFDAEHVNCELIPQGYVYSSGYGRFCKPHFFLGDLIHRRSSNDFEIYISSCEYARDLVAPPAMLQGRTIYIRLESVRRVLWEKIEEWRWNRKNEAMARAMSAYDFDADAESALERMTLAEAEAMILHELGEGMAGDALGEDWQKMINAFARSKAELVARAVRDLAADFLSTLPGLMDRNAIPSLHFFFANYGGMRRHLFPEAMRAYESTLANNDLGAVRELARNGGMQWMRAAEEILEIWRQHGAGAGALVEQRFVPDLT